MILAACGGRGNGEKDAEGLARAESGEGSGRWGGWTGRRGNGEGWMAMGRGRQEGGNLEVGNEEGSNRDGKRVAMGRGTTWRRRWRGGQWQGGGGQWERGDGEGARGRGRRGGGKGEGEKKVQEERDFTDMMKCLGGMRLQSFLTLFTRATPGTPASNNIIII